MEMKPSNVQFGKRKIADLHSGEAPALQDQYVTPMLKQMCEQHDLSMQAAIAILMQSIVSYSAGTMIPAKIVGDMETALEATSDWFETMAAGFAGMAATMGFSRRELMKEMLRLEKHMTKGERRDGAHG